MYREIYNNQLCLKMVNPVHKVGGQLNPSWNQSKKLFLTILVKIGKSRVNYASSATSVSNWIYLSDFYCIQIEKVTSSFRIGKVGYRFWSCQLSDAKFYISFFCFLLCIILHLAFSLSHPINMDLTLTKCP